MNAALLSLLKRTRLPGDHDNQLRSVLGCEDDLAGLKGAVLNNQETKGRNNEIFTSARLHELHMGIDSRT